MEPQGNQVFRFVAAASNLALALLASCSSAPQEPAGLAPVPEATAAARPSERSGEQASDLAILAAPAAVPSPAGYSHDHFGTKPVDIRRDFIAFTLSFDGKDGGECLGVPEWVAYELRATPPNLGQAPTRPPWTTDTALFQQRIAPSDASYKGSDYSRGHMCMKSHAHRISDAADRETHTVLNACPQLQDMNNGVWKSIEDLTGDWADNHHRVWIVTGPVFLSQRPRTWIGDAGEVPVAVPDAFFKVVIKENGNTLDLLSFLVPMEGDAGHTKSKADVRPYLTSVDIIESLTGLDLLTTLDDPLETDLEKRIFTDLWATKAITTPAPLQAAPRGPPTETAAAPQAVQVPKAPPPPIAAPTPKPIDAFAGIALRPGCQASEGEQLQAKKLRRAGWEYHMPRPKSAQAAWGNSDGRTTWWSGYWHNAAKGTYSSTIPSESDGWKGDGISATGWRRGGSPGAPSVIEWLCSTSGGIPPR